MFLNLDLEFARRDFPVQTKRRTLILVEEPHTDLPLVSTEDSGSTVS
jgi:hypothetical protein